LTAPLPVLPVWPTMRYSHHAAQLLGKLVKHRPQLRLQVGPAGGKRQVTWHVDLQLAVRHADHVGAGGGALHRGAFVFHALAPKLAHDCAHRATCHRTNAGAFGRAFFTLAHGGAGLGRQSETQHDGEAARQMLRSHSVSF
jgi:hypothetical protein